MVWYWYIILLPGHGMHRNWCSFLLSIIQRVVPNASYKPGYVLLRPGGGGSTWNDEQRMEAIERRIFDEYIAYNTIESNYHPYRRRHTQRALWLAERGRWRREGGKSIDDNNNTVEVANDDGYCKLRFIVLVGWAKYTYFVIFLRESCPESNVGGIAAAGKASHLQLCWKRSSFVYFVSMSGEMWKLKLEFPHAVLLLGYYILLNFSRYHN